MEDQYMFSYETEELLDAETLKLVSELTYGIDFEPYPGEEDTHMISLNALRGNAEAAASANGHSICWDSNQRGSCGLCDADGYVSLDPLITDDSEAGTFYHGPLFNEECSLDEYDYEEE